MENNIKIIENKRYKIIMRLIVIIFILFYLYAWFIIHLQELILLIILYCFVFILDTHSLITIIRRIDILKTQYWINIIILKMGLYIMNTVFMIIVLLNNNAIQIFYLILISAIVFYQPYLFDYVIKRYNIPDHFFDPVYSILFTSR